MKRGLKIPLLDLVLCLSDAMDFISPAVVSHHKQVAYIASSIGLAMGLPPAQQRDLVLAGAMHDIGAFSLKERIDTLRFEMAAPFEHAERGYRMLRLFEPLAAIASVVRFHHVDWKRGDGANVGDQPVPLAGHILHLADRIAVLIDRDKEVLGQVQRVCEKVRAGRGRMFMPEAVDSFMTLAEKEYFWFDLVSPAISEVLADRIRSSVASLDLEELHGFSRLFAHIIDFKSPFTATHSSGVAAAAELLAGYARFSGDDRMKMRIAGHLHDLGKLAVPVEILDKPARLARKERNIIRHHAFYTHRILETIPSLEKITRWASFHHERLDGSGYPFHLAKRQLPLGAQIVAVADIFTAVTENRPYRAGMTMDGAMKLLNELAGDSLINGEIVYHLGRNYDEVDAARMAAQAAANREYRRIRQGKGQPV